jgi:RNA polymerase sigma-70 factor (ECF subfamily)
MWVGYPGAPYLNRETFEDLYRRLETPLYNTVYRWVWREQDALDLVQEAFLKLWAVRERVNACEAKPYLFRIALNLAANRRRTMRLWQMVGVEAATRDQPSHEGELLKKESERRVRRALDQLPEKQRKVILLARFGEMKYKEIGALLKIPEGTVASRYHKAIAHLKKTLNAEEQPS